MRVFNIDITRKRLKETKNLLKLSLLERIPVCPGGQRRRTYRNYSKKRPGRLKNFSTFSGGADSKEAIFRGRAL